MERNELQAMVTDLESAEELINRAMHRMDDSDEGCGILFSLKLLLNAVTAIKGAREICGVYMS